MGRRLTARVRDYWTPPIPCSRKAHAWYVVARVRSWFREDVDEDLAAAEAEFVAVVRERLGRPGAAGAWVVVWLDRRWFALERWWWTPR